MPTLARVLYQDPFSPILLSEDSEVLLVSQEQRMFIREILEVGASDTRFAQKMYDAIYLVLTAGPTVPPVVESLNPSTVVIGSPSFDIHVIGTGFTPTSKIIFNGFEEPTTFVSETELSTGVSMDLWIAPADVPVAVQNANGVMSEAITFSFTDTAALLAEKAEEKKKEDARLKAQAEIVKKQLEEVEAAKKKAAVVEHKVEQKSERSELHDMKDVKDVEKDKHSKK